MLPTWLLWTALIISTVAALLAFIWKSDEDFYGIEEFKQFSDAVKRGKGGTK